MVGAEIRVTAILPELAGLPCGDGMTIEGESCGRTLIGVSCNSAIPAIAKGVKKDTYNYIWSFSSFFAFY